MRKATAFVVLVSLGSWTTGCMVTGVPGWDPPAPRWKWLEDWAKGGARLPSCALVEARTWKDTGGTPHHTTFSDPRARETVAVVVARNRFHTGPITTTVVAMAVDEQSQVWELGTFGKRLVDLPLNPGDGWPPPFLALLPSSHEIVLRVQCDAEGEHSFLISGHVHFTTEAGGLYSLQACQSNEGTVFWVRDEKSLECVSEECPAN